MKGLSLRTSGHGKHVQVNLNKSICLLVTMKFPACQMSFFSPEVLLLQHYPGYPVKMCSSSISCHIHEETGTVAMVLGRG